MNNKKVLIEIKLKDSLTDLKEVKETKKLIKNLG